LYRVRYHPRRPLTFDSLDVLAANRHLRHYQKQIRSKGKPSLRLPSIDWRKEETHNSFPAEDIGVEADIVLGYVHPPLQQYVSLQGAGVV
jgi:hypothetical protein